MFVFTTTTKRKSPLQKQDTADSSALPLRAPPAHPHTPGMDVVVIESP